MALDPDSNEARLAAHRRLHAVVPEGHEPPKSAALEAAEERLRLAALEVADAISYVDSIRTGEVASVSYETMQKANFNRPRGWHRKYNLKDAKSDANCAAMRLRNAWQILDPCLVAPRKALRDAPAVPVRAYQHPTSPDCVSADPHAYASPRELVDAEALYDHVDWLEKGICEWRAYAIETGRQLKIERDLRKALEEA